MARFFTMIVGTVICLVALVMIWLYLEQLGLQEYWWVFPIIGFFSITVGIFITRR